MNVSAPDPESFLPLTFAVYHILLSLADTERHGYGIIREIEERTEGQLRMAPGTLFGAISRMLDQGLIEESDARPAPEEDDSRRRYYRLSELGRRVAVAESERLVSLVKMARAKRVLPVLAQGGRGE